MLSVLAVCRRLPLHIGLMLALAASSAFAEPAYNVTRRSFADSNGNGVIDCGEIVTLQLVLFDNDPVDLQSTGRITLPSDFPSRWSFLAGTVQQDFSFTVRCFPTIVRGNGPNDGGAVIDYTCLSPTEPNSQGYVLTMTLQGFYAGPSGSIRIPSTAEVLSPTQLTLNDLFTDTTVASCATADLILTKSDGGTTATRGQTLAYTLTYRNNGSSTATNTTLSETVPAHTAFNSSGSSTGWTCSPSNAAGSVCSLVHGGLVAGGSASKVFAVDVLTATPPSVSLLTNTATISSAVAEANAADNSATDTTPLTAGVPDLVVSKTFTSASAVPGSVATSTISVNNAGSGWAQSVVIADQLPAHSTFEAPASSSGWTCSPSSCSLPIGDLAPGASASRTLAVRIDSPLPAGFSDLSNTACASTSTPGNPPGNDCATASIPVSAAANLSLAKTLASGNATPGSTLIYNFTITNSGNQDASGVVLSETVPQHSVFAPGSSHPAWVCSAPAAGSSCTLPIGSLAGGGASLTRTFAVTVLNPLPAGATTVRNTACVGSACDSVETPTDGSPRLAVSKTPVAGSAKPGEVLIYEIAVQNTGNQQAGTVSLRETVPAHTVFAASASDPAWTCSGTAAGSTCTLAIGALDAGSPPTTRLFAVRLDAPFPAGATLSNTVCAILASTADVCSTVVTPPDASPQLAISKTLASGSPSPGALLIYNLTVSNAGNQDAAAVTLSEVISASSTFAPASSSPGWSCSPASGSAGAACFLTLAALPAGSTATRQFAITLADPFDAQQVSNTACASTDPGLSVCSTVSHPRVGYANLTLTKSFNGPPLQPGALLPFLLRVTNSGTAAAANLLLSETVPVGSTFDVAASDPRWTCSGPAAGSRCALELDALAAGASVEVTFALRAAAPLPAGLRQISNAACLTLGSGEALACDDTATPLPVFVEASLDDLLQTDDDGDGRLDSGDILRYTLVVSNSSTSTARALTITTQIDPHLALVVGSVETTAGAIASGSTPGDATLTVTLPELAPGSSLTITFDTLALDLQGLTSVSSQALVRSTNAEDEPSDDPETQTVDDDPTVTTLDGPIVPGIPTLGSLGVAVLALSLGTLATRRMRRAGGQQG